PVREKGFRQAVVFAARSLPGFGPFFPAAYLFGFRISPVTADLFAAAVAVDLGPAVVVAAVGLGSVVVVVAAAAVVAVAAFVDSVLVGSVVAAFSFEAGRRCLEALDHLETSLIP